jgi:membrane protein YqaA with SNARE-associated domain
MHEIMGIAAREDFWVGAISSMVATMIVAIVVYVFRRSLALTQAQRDRRREDDELFEQALDGSNELAPFAYGVVQARALRYFLLAVFVAYVGDIFGIFWPFNSFIYLISLASFGRGCAGSTK